MQIKQVSIKWLQQINYSSYAGRWRYKQRTNMAVVEYKSGRRKLETEVDVLATCNSASWYSG